MPIYEPAKDELLSRLKWFVQLRWVFLLVLALLLVCATQYFNLDFHLLPIGIIAVGVFAYNCIFYFLHERDGVSPEPSALYLRIEANLQIGLDLATLALLLYFSGSIENPFIFFFVFHMILGSILLSGRDVWYQAAIAVTFFSLLVVLSAWASSPITGSRASPPSSCGTTRPIWWQASPPSREPSS